VPRRAGGGLVRTLPSESVTSRVLFGVPAGRVLWVVVPAAEHGEVPDSSQTCPHLGGGLGYSAATGRCVPVLVHGGRSGVGR
jgi:hypothetical protein